MQLMSRVTEVKTSQATLTEINFASYNILPSVEDMLEEIEPVNRLTTCLPITATPSHAFLYRRE